MLSDTCKFTLSTGAVADGTAETVSAVADMADFDEVLFKVNLGDVDAAAVLTFALKENTANSTSSPTPTQVPLTQGMVSGAVTSVITTGNAVITEASANLDNKCVLINVAKSVLTKRYVFLSITATVESYEVVSIEIIQARPRVVPVTQPAGVVSVVQAAF